MPDDKIYLMIAKAKELPSNPDMVKKSTTSTTKSCQKYKIAILAILTILTLCSL
ncbi:MAG: hypothetical protein ACOYUZ_03190 [Patescibacteria group bacterium]